MDYAPFQNLLWLGNMKKKKICFWVVFCSCLFVSVSAVAQVAESELEKQALKESENGNKALALDLYSKAGYTYWSGGNLEKAIQVFSEAIRYAAELNNRNALITLNNNLALLYTGKEDYQNALKYFQKAYELIHQLRTQREQAEALMNIASAYEELKDYELAKRAAEEAMQIAQEEQDLRLMRKAAGLLASCYEKLGKSDQAFQYFEQFSALDRQIKAQEYQSIRKEADAKVAVAEQELSRTAGLLRETSDSLAVVARIAELQKMEIELRTSQLREKEAQLKYERYIRKTIYAGTAGIFLFLLIVSVMLVLKVRDNRILREQKKKIQEQNLQIQKQNELLDLQNRNIKDSIHYATTIQKAILPPEQEINQVADSAILFLPKDIVSGDFYWFSRKNNRIILAMADCTGHGVPGAFMSMIGTMLLNEIVNEQGIEEPAVILEELDQKLRIALRQEASENNDGMDIAIVQAYQSEDYKWNVRFAGARRPVIYSRNGVYSLIEGSKHSIGGMGTVKVKKDFSLHSFVLQAQDEIILFSDGMIDQPDKNRKRYGVQRFQQFLSNYQDRTPAEKADLLEKELQEFSCEPQRDDITVWIVKLR